MINPGNTRNWYLLIKDFLVDGGQWVNRLPKWVYAVVTVTGIAGVTGYFMVIEPQVHQAKQTRETAIKTDKILQDSVLVMLESMQRQLVTSDDLQLFEERIKTDLDQLDRSLRTKIDHTSVQFRKEIIYALENDNAQSKKAVIQHFENQIEILKQLISEREILIKPEPK